MSHETRTAMHVHTFSTEFSTTTDHSTGGVSKTTALSGSDFINFQPAAADYGDPLLLLAHSRGHPRPRGASIVALSLVISHGKRGLWYVFGR